MELEMNRNRIYIIAAVAVVLILLWMVFRPSAVRVDTARAKRTELLDTVDAEARTRVKRKFTVTAPVTGKLKRIELKEGDNILRGYPITEVDPNPPLEQHPSEWGPSPSPYSAKVFAPAAGRVLRVFEKSERFLQVGTPLIEIGDPSSIEIVVDVLSSDAVRIRAGSAMIVDDPTSGETFRAQVRTIEPQAVTKISALGVEERRVDVIADFLDQGRPSFGDNFRLDVRIVVWEGDNVLSVPNSALFRTGDDWTVFVVEGGRARLRNVAVGHRSRTDTEIVEGLSEGETVVMHPPSTLEEGTRVTEE